MMEAISSVEALKALYDAPLSVASVAKVTNRLTREYRKMIELSPFVALATVGPEGLDCSPRGDRGGVVRIIDDRSLQLPDWRGNNRIDSLLNIVRDPRLSLMFMIPGSSTVMRINGQAIVTADPSVLESFEMDGRHPRSVIAVTIDEVYFQCARAVMRADLWNSEHFVAKEDMPTPGEMLKAATADFDHEAYDREWSARAARTMW